MIWYLPAGVRLPRPVTGPLWYRIHEGEVQRADNETRRWLISYAYGHEPETFLKECEQLLIPVDGLGQTTHSDYSMDIGL